MYDAEYVIQVDYDGNIVWHTNRGDHATLPNGNTLINEGADGRVPGSAPHGGASVAEVGLISDLP